MAKNHRLLCALLMLLTVAAPAAGQFGVKGGLSVSGLIGDDYRTLLGYEIDWFQDKDAYPHLGFQIGGFYTRPVGARLAVQPEIHLVSRGLDWYRSELYASSLKTRFYYVQIPVLLRYGPLLGGPYAAIRLAGKSTLELWDETTRRSVPGVAPFDFGFTFAISPSFSLWSRSLLVELRLDWGLTNITDSPVGATPFHLYPDRVSTVAIMLMTGMRF